MITQSSPVLDRSSSPAAGTATDDAQLARTAAALEANGFAVRRAADGAEARQIVLDLIPDGALIHHGASVTLETTGLSTEIEKSGRFEPLRVRLATMNRETQFDEMRRLASAPDVMLGSVAAVTETGSLIAASASGSQLGPYVGGAGHVILVVGKQKIVADVEAGLRRLYDVVYPMEEARAQATYGVSTAVNKVLIMNREFRPGRVTVVLVDEALGF